jgi:hypothetical protein
MELGLELEFASAPVRQQASLTGLAASHDCESFAAMPLSTLLYHVLTESLFLGPVAGMRGSRMIAAEMAET